MTLRVKDSTKVIYINYSDANYRRNQTQLIHHVRTELKDEFQGCIPYTREWLVTKDFYKDNRSILDKDRLAGYTIWKPYIILTAFEEINEGDIVVYMDCGDIPWYGLRDKVWKFMHGFDHYFLEQYPQNLNRAYTKRDCFYYMGCDEEKYWDAPQVEGGFMAWKKTESSVHLLNEYIKYCTDERIVTDIPNQCGLPNLPEFKDHRHDQSVISNMQVKHGLVTVTAKESVDGEYGAGKMDWGAGSHIKWNMLFHRNGKQFANGTYKWGPEGRIK